MENFKIISEKINPLFGRREIQASVNSVSAPSREEVKEFLISKLSISENVLKIEKIQGRFGSNEFILTLKIYKSEEDRKSIEHKTKKEVELEKKALEEAKKAEKERREKEEAQKKASLEESSAKEIKSEGDNN
jgi:ribosomal protein S24E